MMTRNAAEALPLEQWTRLLLETVVDYSFMFLDRDGQVVKWNDGAGRIKGYTIAVEVLGCGVKLDPHEIVGKPAIVKLFQDLTAAVDASGGCIFGTFGIMDLLGYSLDILSLMALTIATGFVVDDAIVVMENIARHMEEGMPRLQAAFRGAREVGFTVLSISLSLIMVFLPILLMGGILGRLFREFTVTLSIAILVSLVISLTTTPMLCALFLKTQTARGPEGRPKVFM